MNKYPDRVTLQPNGCYVWIADIDQDMEREGIRIGGRICKGFAFCVFLAGVIISILQKSWMPFLYMTGFAVVVLLITIGVVNGLENWPGSYKRAYRLSDTHISTGSGRRKAVYTIAKTKVIIIGENYIEMRARFGAFRAYIPKEDFNFVRGYIQSRVPMECELRYARDRKRGK